MNRVIGKGGLDDQPILEALHRLISAHLVHREFLAFQWRPDSLDEDAGGTRWLPYGEALDALFLRGQKEGVFRIDIAAPELTEIFISLVFGMLDAERRGRVACAGMVVLIEQFFLKGAISHSV